MEGHKNAQSSSDCSSHFVGLMRASRLALQPCLGLLPERRPGTDSPHRHHCPAGRWPPLRIGSPCRQMQVCTAGGDVCHQSRRTRSGAWPGARSPKLSLPSGQLAMRVGRCASTVRLLLGLSFFAELRSIGGGKGPALAGQSFGRELIAISFL
jgi:hypothetical protein